MYDKHENVNVIMLMLIWHGVGITSIFLGFVIYIYIPLMGTVYKPMIFVIIWNSSYVRYSDLILRLDVNYAIKSLLHIYVSTEKLKSTFILNSYISISYNKNFK